MKKITFFLNHYRYIFGLIFVSIALFFLTTPLLASEEIEENETENSEQAPQAPVETVKENLKERHEKIIKEQTSEETKKTKKAWVGKLQSIANNTLTIETSDGPKLASVSGETTYVRYPSRAEIKLSDLEIESFTIAMGYVNGNQVLEAIRIVIENEAPKKPTKTSAFVTFGDYNSKADTLTAMTRDKDEMVFEIDRDAEITSSSSEAEDLEFSDLENGQRAIIIYETSFKNDKPTYTLNRLHLLPAPPAPQEELGPEVDYPEESEESTPSSPAL